MTQEVPPGAAQAAPRRTRTASESLLSIVLGLEAALTFFITVTAFGLKVVTPAIAFGGGAVLFVLLLVAARYVRKPWGLWLGWSLQAGLILIGLLMPLMYFIGAVFLALWVYCFIMGHRLDARNRTRAAEQTKEHP